MRKLIVALFGAALLVGTPAHAQLPGSASDSASRLQRLGRALTYGTATGFAFAAYDQVTNNPSQWGHGFSGFGKRVASNLGEFYIQEGVTEGLAAVMNRPLSYKRCTCREFGDRVGWAALGAVTDVMPDGSRRVAVPRIVGAYVGSMAQEAWRPSNGDRVRVGLVNGTTSLAIGALINMYYEFRK
jgi:hypothetical protein